MTAMKDGKVTDQELDALGRSVIKAALLSPSDIDEIVSKRGLYDGVLAKIVVETGRKPRSRWLIWSPAVVSAAFVVIISVPLIAYIWGMNTTASHPRVIYSVKEDRNVFNTVPAEPPPSLPAEPFRPEPAVYTRSERRPEPRIRQSRATATRPPEAHFEPIGFSANAEDAILDGRVVRVEMPRSALFALGVDLPLENGTKAVKADLLVGSDGTPRGIRLVE